MNNSNFKTVLLAAIFALIISGCKQNDPPVPAEQELITTLKLNIGTQTFVFKVENGFGTSNPGTIQIDTIKLHADSNYLVIAELLNERKNPAEDITGEVISEKDDHLFLYVSNPATGAGSIATSNGSLDNNNAPFNQTVRFNTGQSGTGILTVYLLHQPTNKSGTTPATSGGATDVEAVFPVVIE